MSTIYDAFAFSMSRNLGLIDQEIINLHTMFMLQSGYYAKDKCYISGKLVKSLQNQEITLISLKKALEILEPYTEVFHEILIKAIPNNFTKFAKEDHHMMSYQKDDSEYEKSLYNEDDISFVEENLLTSESKSIYLIDYLYSFININ